MKRYLFLASSVDKEADSTPFAGGEGKMDDFDNDFFEGVSLLSLKSTR